MSGWWGLMINSVTRVSCALRKKWATQFPRSKIVAARVWFLFKAEAGIRDVAVTGVQTCALPICLSPAGDKPRVIILGSGPNRIGQGIEFDYCCVHAAQSFRALGFETVMVNCNPETVSTDYEDRKSVV